MKNIISRLSGFTPRRRRLSILAEWTRHCNLECPMCPIDAPTMRPAGQMSLDLWERILDCCKREGHFVDWVHHLGEPLTWKNFFEGMRLWRKSGLSKLGHISTNGLLLTDDRIHCIDETGIGFIRICIDTLDPTVYKRLRANDKHSIVINNIHRLLDRAPNIQCQVQLMRTSLYPDESPKDFFKEFGVRPNLRIFVTQCMDVGGDKSLTLCRNVNPDPRTCLKLNYEHCPITWDGQIGLCCVDYRLLNRLGSMEEGSISSVYLGKYAEDVRSRVRRGDYSLAPACGTCPMDHVNYTCASLASSDLA